MNVSNISPILETFTLNETETVSSSILVFSTFPLYEPSGEYMANDPTTNGNALDNFLSKYYLLLICGFAGFAFLIGTIVVVVCVVGKMKKHAIIQEENSSTVRTVGEKCRTESRSTERKRSRRTRKKKRRSKSKKRSASKSRSRQKRRSRKVVEHEPKKASSDVYIVMSDREKDEPVMKKADEPIKKKTALFDTSVKKYKESFPQSKELQKAVGDNWSSPPLSSRDNDRRNRQYTAIYEKRNNSDYKLNQVKSSSPVPEEFALRNSPADYVRTDTTETTTDTTSDHAKRNKGAKFARPLMHIVSGRVDSEKSDYKKNKT